MHGEGPDQKQLNDIEDHAGRIFATLAPHLILRVDTDEGQGTEKFKKWKDYDTVETKYRVKTREVRVHFYVDRKPNVEPYFSRKRFGEIVKESGLSKPTVSYHLDMLMAEGLVIKVPTGYLVNPLHFQL